MSLASNLLQLIFCLIVGVASLLGALFIIGFLLATPRNEFDDDDHDMAQPIFIPVLQPGKCGQHTAKLIVCEMLRLICSFFLILQMIVQFKVCQECYH